MPAADETLDARLLAAHAEGDLARLADLYAEAGRTAPDARARAFYLTQAYIFALDCGAASAPALRADLVALGAETP